jgi:phosphoribosylformylglycinamidine synthase subunit PurS
MFDVRVTVRLKKGVSDPEGKNTEKALHLLGFDQVQKVTTLRVFDMHINSSNEKDVKHAVEQMCQRLLTNPVIHDYDISIQNI